MSELLEEIEKITESQTADNVKYKIPRMQQYVRMGIKPVTKRELRTRFACDGLERTYPERLIRTELDKKHGKGNYEFREINGKSVHAYPALGYINAYYISNGNHDKIQIPYRESLKVSVKIESLNSYAADVIPNRILELIGSAKENGFFNFRVAYPYAEYEELKDPIVVASYPIKTFSDLVLYISRPKNRKMADIGQWE